MTRRTHAPVQYLVSALILASTCVAGAALPLSLTADTISLKAPSALAQTTATTGAGSAAPSTASAKTKVNTYDTECSINPLYFSINGCFNVFLSWLGSWFLAFGAMILRLAGTLFDNLVSHIVVGFRNSLDTLRITPAIAEAWSIFRDFSNILIIGIFTFIAVSIILGLKEFGQKKLIANVLIIAVLINFSLLFTKMIIDASNFAAFAIYKQMAAQPETFDIAQAFLTPMKITSIWNDSGEATKKVLKETGSGYQAFFFGFVGGAMLLATAGVILYGCFLIAARGVLLIVLMLTSALAFATYLLPNLANSTYGWKEWWKTLINAAIFAPLLMLLLSISLAIVSAAGAVAQTPIGSVVSDPRQQLSGDSWTTILLYIIGVGTLFFSFRLASSFAGKISGFNIAALAPAVALGLGSRFAGILGRQTIGRGSSAASEALKRRAQNAPDGSIRQSLYSFGSRGFRSVAKSDMNLARTPLLGGAIAKTAGMDLKTLAGKEVKGFEGSLKRRAEKFAEKADMLHVDGKKQGEITAQAIKKELSNNAGLGGRHAEATQAADTHKTDQNAAQKEYDATRKAREQAEFERNQAERAGDSAAKTAAEKKVKEHDTNLRKQEERIKSATEKLSSANTVIKNIEDEAKANAIARGKQFFAMGSKLKEEYKSEAELGEHLAHKRYTNLLARATGLSTKDNDR